MRSIRTINSINKPLRHTGMIFPGQGSQHTGMMKDLLQNFPSIVSPLVTKANSIMSDDLLNTMFEGPEEKLQQTNFAQPAIFLHSSATLEVIKSESPRLLENISVALGHSLGEFSALYACGVLEFDEAFKLVKTRGELMHNCTVSGQNETEMSALIILQKPQDFQSFLSSIEDIVRVVDSSGHVCQLANINSPQQVVLSGHSKAIGQVIEQIKKKITNKFKTKKLNVSAPFHCSLMKPAQEQLQLKLQEIKFHKPTLPFISNVTGTMTEDPVEIKKLVSLQITSSVKWNQSIETCKSMGVHDFIEIGPGSILTNLFKQIDPNLRSM